MEIPQIHASVAAYYLEQTDSNIIVSIVDSKQVGLQAD
jgi:hypothetical protein